MSISQWKKRFYGMPSGKRWAKLFRNYDLVIQVELYYEHWKCHGDNEFFNDQMKDLLIRMKEMKQLPLCEVAVCHSQQYNDLVTSCGSTLGCNPTTINVPFIAYDGTVGMVQYQEGNNPMNTINTTATANVTQKTDLQTQREYLLSRWGDISRDYDRHYGTLAAKMRTAFGIDVHGERPKTAEELFDGITSGKYKLDAKKLALQEIAVAQGHGFEADDDVWVSADDFTYAIDFGDPTPNRLGYETARETFAAGLKAAKDTIMIGDPATGLSALQALEAWTPPAVAN